MRAPVPLLLAAASWLSAQAPLTLPEALRLAASASLPADLADLARAGARGQSREVQSSYLPVLQFQGGHLNLDHDSALRTEPFTLGPIPGLGQISIPGLEQPVAQQSSWRYQLTASYLVYDFGKRDSALAAARHQEQAVDLQGGGAVCRAQAEAAARYMAVMNVQARRRVVAQRRQAIQDHLKDARVLFDQGVVARNDLLRTEVALRTVDDSGRALDNALSSAREGLNVALGSAPEVPRTLPDALPLPPRLPWDEAEVRRLAAAGNGAVKALQARLKAAESQVDFRKRDYAPDLTAQVGHSYEENRYLVHPEQTTLYLGVSWKLFDGGARSARISESRAQAESARRELLDARRQAENAAAAAFRDCREALAEWDTAKADETAALENLRIVTDQYQQAYAKSADVLDAEAILADSRFGLADCLCRAYAQEAALLATLGQDAAAFFERTEH